MNFDIKLEDNNLTIYCSKKLENFSKEFIDYYNKNINIIKDKLMINEQTNIIISLTDDIEKTNFVYDVSDFAGFFTSTGAFVYINLYGKKSKEYMFKGLMHEITHYLYKYYVYGKDKKRIVWVDEGIAQFISGQKDNLLDINEYKEFLNKNLETNINLNILNHEDKSFNNNNGYNLSYIAIRYLYETNDLKSFINIISNYDLLIEIGEYILNDIRKYYSSNKTL